MPKAMPKGLARTVATWCATLCLAGLPLAVLPSQALADEEAAITVAGDAETGDELLETEALPSDQGGDDAGQQLAVDADGQDEVAATDEPALDVPADPSLSAPAAEDAACDESEPAGADEASGEAGTTDPAMAQADSKDPSLEQAQASVPVVPAAEDEDIDTNKNGWVEESGEDGSAYRYYDHGVVRTGWLITDTNPITKAKGLDRYWLDSTGALAVNRLIDPATDGGNSYYAYSTINGNVVRGKYVNGMGYVYLADNDGRLAGTGWLVSSAYGDGLQRYFIEKAVHAAVPGYASTGYDHYTRPEGYVVRGKYIASDGNVYLAKNDGRLEADGWLVSKRYDGGLQRYYIDESVHACVPGYSTDGYAHYTTKAGYVLRGATDEDGQMRIANNDGLLVEGWVVADAFGYGLQRYWQRGGQVVKDELIETGANAWAFARPEGYVVRGKYIAPDGRIFLANNDGKLENPGWLVSAAYDGGLQRYYIDGASHAATTGFFSVAGKGYYGMIGLGYVARSGISSIKADNDGVLRYAKGWLVTDAFGHGLQRYWVQGGAPVTSKLISSKAAGYWAYARPEGYVVRGKWVDAATGNVYLANNDGKLENPGWVTTSRYDGATQLYRIDSTTHAAVIGSFTVGGNEYLGLEGKGYVLTGHGEVNNVAYDADANGVLYPTINASVSNRDATVVTKQQSLVANGSIYVMLPSFADISKVELSATMPSGSVVLLVSVRGEDAYVERGMLDLTAAGIARDGNGAYLFDVKTGSAKLVRQLAIMCSDGIGALYVTSVDPEQGRRYIEASRDHSAKAEVCVLMVDAEGNVTYNKDTSSKTSKIKGRGNSTWGFGIKKPYQITLNKKADLLSTGNKDNENKKWILLANSNDATQLHSLVTFDLVREATGRGIECAPIDLYYDGEYRGTYLLCEKVEIKNGRIDIYDLEGAIEDANKGADLSENDLEVANNSYGYKYRYVKGVVDPENITGGYLLEMDGGYYQSEPCWFDSSWGFIVVKSPEFCSQAAMRYISEKFEAAIRQLDNNDLDPQKSMIDLDSLAFAYLVNEFTKNIDAFFSSTYLYKDKDSDRFVFEPLWDFDGSMGVRTESSAGEFITYQGFVSPHVKNIEHSGGNVGVLNNPKVRASVQGQWRNVLSLLVTEVLLSDDEEALGSNGTLHSLTYYRELTKASLAMDNTAFGITVFRNEIKPFTTYERNFQYMVDWLGWRTSWVTDNLWRLNTKKVSNAPFRYEGVYLGLVFDAGYYRSRYADLASMSDEALLQHFYTYGMAEGRVASRNFDVRAYKARYADLRAAFGDDLKSYYSHYITNGFYEGRIA